MNRSFTILLLSLGFGSALTSCVDTADQKVQGPSTETSAIPWNSPIAGQGQGQFGMMPQNQYRR